MKLFLAAFALTPGMYAFNTWILFSVIYGLPHMLITGSTLSMGIAYGMMYLLVPTIIFCNLSYKEVLKIVARMDKK